MDTVAKAALERLAWILLDRENVYKKVTYKDLHEAIMEALAAAEKAAVDADNKTC